MFSVLIKEVMNRDETLGVTFPFRRQASGTQAKILGICYGKTNRRNDSGSRAAHKLQKKTNSGTDEKRADGKRASFATFFANPKTVARGLRQPRARKGALHL